MTANPPVDIYGPRATPPEGVRANVTPAAAADEDTDLSDIAPFSALSPFNIGPVSAYPGIKRREAKIMSNGYNFSKGYKKHLDSEGAPTAQLALWTRSGFEDAVAQRFPMGRGAKPEYSLWKGERLGYQQARLLIYIPMYVEAIVRTPAARTAFIKLRVLRRRAAEEGKPLVLFDYDGYQRKKLSYADVICADRKMGHAFVLGMMLEDQLMSAVSEAAKRLMPDRVLTPNDLPPDFAPLRKSELLKTLSVGGARINLRQRFLNRLADRMLEALLPGGGANIPWKYDTIMMYGRECQEGRMTAHFGDPGTSYRYSGKDHTPAPWSDDPTRVLAECRHLVWEATGQLSNYLLLNLYRNYSDKLNPHSDSESDLVPGSLICSISLGGERNFIFEARNMSGSAGCRPPAQASEKLEHGSLLTMGGLCQKMYKHSVPEGPAPRVNLTFRLVKT
jgi:alkylated DNA repair dioxygenase AlkB